MAAVSIAEINKMKWPNTICFKHGAVCAQPKSDTCWTKYILPKEYLCLPYPNCGFKGRHHFYMAVVLIPVLYLPDCQGGEVEAP